MIASLASLRQTQSLQDSAVFLLIASRRIPTLAVLLFHKGLANNLDDLRLASQVVFLFRSGRYNLQSESTDLLQNPGATMA